MFTKSYSSFGRAYKNIFKQNTPCKLAHLLEGLDSSVGEKYM